MAISYQKLDSIILDYLISQISTGDDRKIQRALQELNRRYRLGYRIDPTKVFQIENSIIGLLSTRPDKKVRRWSINTLARLSSTDDCVPFITKLIVDYPDDGESRAAGIAAVYKLSARPERVLDGLSLNPLEVVLAALQHVDQRKLNLSLLPIDIDKANPEILKLALINVGLNTAPRKLFKNKFGGVVKALGQHDDPIVTQYSVWAITENKALGFRNLGVSIKDIDRYPEKVRSWTYQLLASNEVEAVRRHEYIVLGSKDVSSETRRGLAAGLRDTYYDGLEELTTEWVYTEHNEDVRAHLLEHIAVNAQACEQYEKITLEFYASERPESALRKRLKACVIGTPMYRNFRKIEYETPDLLAGVPQVTNNFVFNGPVNNNNASYGGDVDNSGSNSINSTVKMKTVDDAIPHLANAEVELKAFDGNHAELGARNSALQLIEDAKSDPSVEKVYKATEALKEFGNIANLAASAGSTIVGIIANLSSLVSSVTL